MIRNFCVKPYFNYKAGLIIKNVNSYVKQKQIDQITKTYGQGNLQKIKKFGAIFKHILTEGFKALRSDLSRFKELKSKQNLNNAQLLQTMRINNDILKLGPLFIIQILPFSGPLFMLYMYTYPGSIPSWFLIDYYHDRHEQLKVRNQTKNLKYFKEKGLKPEDINLDTISMRQLRKITLLLFGIYRDGTIGYRKLFNKRIDYFLFEGFSRYLIKRSLYKYFKRDLIVNQITNQMSSLQQMVRWKYNRILKGQYILEYKPLYQNTVQKMKKNAGQESQIFNQLQKIEQIQNQKASNGQPPDQKSPNGKKQNNPQR